MFLLAIDRAGLRAAGSCRNYRLCRAMPSAPRHRHAPASSRPYKNNCFAEAAPWRPARHVAPHIPIPPATKEIARRPEPSEAAAILRVVTKHPTNGAIIMTPPTWPKSALYSAFLGVFLVVGLAIA